MPFEWIGIKTSEAPDISGASFRARDEPPLVQLHLWPHRSLPRRGFVFFMAATFILLMLPLIAVLGTPVLWGLFPFLMAALALMWWLLEKSYRDGEILEELTLWSDLALLRRMGRNEKPRQWDANPYWVTVNLHGKGGPVESYLTLKGPGREVEIGAFLSKEEREALHPILQYIFRKAALSAGARP